MWPSETIGPHWPTCIISQYLRLELETFGRAPWLYARWTDQCSCAYVIVCDSAWNRAQDTTLREVRVAHETRLLSLEDDWITVEDIDSLLMSLDQARVQKNFPLADTIRARLIHYGVRVETSLDRSRGRVCSGHHVRDYDGWIFS